MSKKYPNGYDFALIRGAKNGNAALDSDKVRSIRRKAVKLYSDGDPVNTTLAREYGVSEGTIRAILQGRTWGHIQ
jgi:hypothetical protein